MLEGFELLGHSSIKITGYNNYSNRRWIYRMFKDGI